VNIRRPPQSPRRAALAVLALAALLTGCAGMRLHDDGMRLAAEGNHEAAIPMLREANRLDPANPQYRIDLLKETTGFAGQLVVAADMARAVGRTAEATDLYQRALAIEPANDKARRGLANLEVDARVAKLVAESEQLMREGRADAARDKVNLALATDANSQLAQRQSKQLRDQADKLRDLKDSQAAARSVFGRPVTLQFRDANLRMVFEALSRTTGLNVILDRDVRADLKTTIFVKDAAVEDTVDLILLQNQLEKRSLNANTLFVYPATPAKQKEYQDLQVRTFQVANADVKYLQTVLKTVLKVKEVSMDERTGTLVIRDTPDAIAVAAKVIAAHDVPDPEVMLEVEVLEISHDRLSNLGIQFPNSLTLSTPTDSGGSLTVAALRALRFSQLLTTPLSLGINLQLQDTDAQLLASPRIRARNKEKARILIGDRVPIIVNTVTPVATGAGVVTGSVSYQDVGLKLEFEPQVYSDQEVGIRISLEVSTIAKEIDGPNGSVAYQIGTRNAQTSVRLRDGETQILGGLISAEDRNTSSKIPGVGHLPVVGKLFGNNNGSTAKTEIVLSITPRILRAPTIVDSSLRDVFSGSESSIRQRALQLEPVGAVRGQSTGGPTPPGAVPSAAQPYSPPAPSVTPSAVPSSVPAPVPAAAAHDAGSAGAMPAPPPPASTPARNLLPLMNGARNGVGAQGNTPASAPAPKATQ